MAKRSTEWSFRAGRKYDSNNNEATIVALLESTSDSQRDLPEEMRTVYTTTRWSDDVLTCNCAGWAFKKGDKPRDCKHCKACRDADFENMQSVADFRVVGANRSISVEEVATMSHRTRRSRGIRLNRRRDVEARS